MKARLLQKLLNTNRTVQELQDKICISSYWVQDLISVDKKSLKLSYAMDTFHEGKKALKSEELEQIWDKLDEMIKDNTIKDIIENNDPIDNMKEFWYFDSINNTIVKSYCDEKCWPNVDYTGKIIYDNTSFNTYEECKNYAIKDLINQLHFTQERLDDVTKRFTNEINMLNKDFILIQKALNKYEMEGK